jgi:hypothetical protein
MTRVRITDIGLYPEKRKDRKSIRNHGRSDEAVEKHGEIDGYVENNKKRLHLQPKFPRVRGSQSYPHKVT